MRHDGCAEVLRVNKWAVFVGFGRRGSVGELLDGCIEALTVGHVLQHDARAVQAHLTKS